MTDRYTKDKVMIACVTGEVTLLVQPAIDNNVDRIHLIHFVKSDGEKDDRARFYQKFYTESEKLLKKAGIEVVEHADAETYVFRKMMHEIYEILINEVNGKKSDVYVNLSGGTNEYAAAAAICSMMFKDVSIFTVSKGYDDRTIDYDQLLKNSMKDGKLVGSCTNIGNIYPMEKFPIERPEDNLLKAFKIYAVIADNIPKNSNTVVIRNLILQNIWLAKGPLEDGAAKNNTSVEFEIPEKGYACPSSKTVEYAKRQRNEAVQYVRMYIQKWETKGWIEAIPHTKKYMITDEGRTVLDVFCSDSLLNYSPKDIVLQSMKYEN